VSNQFDHVDVQTTQIIAALLGAQQSSSETLSKELQNRLSKELKDQTIALTQLLSRLRSSTEDKSWRSRESLVHDSQREEEAQVTQSDRIYPSIEMLDVPRIEEDLIRGKIKDIVLASIYFPAKAQRYEAVSEAHQNTFEWIFQEETAQQYSWSSFLEWLLSGSGVYWVNGKAGSGKSTLLKFIYDDARTRDHLKSWAEGTPLAIAEFFWNSGTTEQKSQTGLLRAILHDIWDQHPELIPVTLPLDWARIYSQLLDPNSGTPTISWSLRKLMAAVKSLVTQTVVSLKLCLFIDGLDEYDGDHEELGEFFKGIASSPHFKICLSSRPLVVFEDLFKRCPSLRLQDLTCMDIQRFVNDRLRSSEVYCDLAMKDPNSALVLVNEIVQKADGVFLWVKIVVGSLLNGFRNRDTILDLEKRLRLFPRELEPLYDHIFSLIDPIYREWASKAFQIMRATQEQRTRRHSNYMPATDAPPLTALALYLAINEEIRHIEVYAMTLENLLDHSENLTVQLTARCAGLLEVKDDDQRIGGHYAVFGLSTTTIHWLHRTARDYIEHPTKWNELLGQTTGSQFNPNTAMLRSCILLLGIQRRIDDKTYYERQYDDRESLEDQAWFLSSSALTYAHHSDSQTIRPQSTLLDQLYVLLSTPFRSGRHPYERYSINWRSYIEEVNPHHFITKSTSIRGFLPLAVTYGLVAYTLEKPQIQISRGLMEEACPSMLHYIPTIAFEQQGQYYPPPRIEMVELLLRLGADPNIRYNFASSTWERAMYLLDRYRLKSAEERDNEQWGFLKEYLGIISLLIRYGAKSDTEIYSKRSLEGGWGHITAEEVFRLASRRHLFRSEIQYLLQDLRNRKVPKQNTLRHDRRLCERRERINNNYTSRRTR
jgi:hypothetical protein